MRKVVNTNAYYHDNYAGKPPVSTARRNRNCLERSVVATMSKKSKTPSFILTLPLQVELWQQHILEKRFNVARQMFNDCLGEATKRIRKMRKDANYKHWIAQPKSEERKQWLNAIREQYGVTE